MGELLSYMLQSALGLTSLYLVYKWVMSRRNQHAYNRATLLSIYAMAFLLPTLPAMHHAVSQFLFSNHSKGTTETSDMPIIVLVDDNMLSTVSLIPIIIVALYIIGVFVMSIATIASYIRLAHIVANGTHTKLSKNNTLVLTKQPSIAPFSWMHYVVINQDDYNECGSMILTHEVEHLHQRHWIDMLISQIVIILQWFNPVAWLMRDELRTVHEYQADAAVLQSGANVRQYQLLLIKKAVGKSFPALANSLNHSNLKKRITMMLKSKSRKSSRWLALALMPAAVAAVAVFNIPAVANALSSVSNAKIPVTVSDDKVTKSTDALNGQLEEISVIKIASKKQTDEKTNRMTNQKNSNVRTEKNSQPQYIVTINGKEVQPDADGNIEYKGSKYKISNITNITPEYINSITVNKEASNITIDLKDPNAQKTEVAAQRAMFPGGDKALLNYVYENVKYPEDAPADGKTYRVIVQFEISSTGKVGAAKIIRSQGESFDSEALRVIRNLPDFEPGKNEKGEDIATTYNLPISFKAIGSDKSK